MSIDDASSPRPQAPGPQPEAQPSATDLAAETGGMFAPLGPGILRRIGHFHVKRIIASGGMGTVYEAVQEQPRRTVALKVMRQELTARSALRRFEFEAQILARLCHPGIAQIYEAGTHDEGAGRVPYFAMEYVPGAKTIVQHAHAAHLSLSERLGLFAQVCDAVHHGHQKGIIHRDLKPSNILVDSAGAPKIIDFGVARATDSDLAVTALQTGVGQIIGTLQYMSPEQIEADPHDIDTRSDVYSLGVVLYELLCGASPYELTGTSMPEAARIIRDVPPGRLAVRDNSLRGDVETVVLKALAKDRQRRYQSAAELARDIRRFLEGEPIEARPLSLWYQLHLLARRNRAAVAAAVVGGIALLAGLALTSWQAIRATRAEQHARTLAAAEADMRVEAVRQAAIAETVSGFLGDMLGALDSSQDRRLIEISRDLKVIDVLDKASQRITGQFDREPLVEAAIRMTLGETYRSIGEYEPAERHLEVALSLRRAALGEEDPLTLTSMHSLGLLHQSRSRYADAEALLDKTLRLRRSVLGEDHADTLKSMNDLGLLYLNRGRFGEAEPLFAQALAGRRRVLGQEHPRTLVSMNNLGLLYQRQERLEEAETTFAQLLPVQRRVRGERDPETLVTMNNLALVMKEAGKYAEAEPIFRRTLEIQRGVLGDRHQNTLITLTNLGDLHNKREQYGAAEPFLTEAIAGARASLPERHWLTGVILMHYGRCIGHLGRFEDAEQALRESHAILEEALGPGHSRTTAAGEALAVLYGRWGRPEEAARWRAAAVEVPPRP